MTPSGLDDLEDNWSLEAVPPINRCGKKQTGEEEGSCSLNEELPMGLNIDKVLGLP